MALAFNKAELNLSPLKDLSPIFAILLAGHVLVSVQYYWLASFLSCVKLFSELVSQPYKTKHCVCL